MSGKRYTNESRSMRFASAVGGQGSRKPGRILDDVWFSGFDPASNRDCNNVRRIYLQVVDRGMGLTHLSLRIRILMTSFFVIGGVFLLGFVVIVEERLERDQREYRNAARSISAALLPTLQNTMVVGDLATIHQTFDAIVKQASVHRLTLLDPKSQQVILETINHNPVTGYAPPQWFYSLLEDANLTEEVDIAMGGIDYGTLRVEMANAALAQELWVVLLRFLVVGCLGLISIVALLRFILDRSLSPLQALQESARLFGKGEFNRRATEDAAPEIAEVSQAFNQMAEDIQRYAGELKTSRDLADEANRAKSDFLATMSHEIRTPLNGILGFAQVLMEDGIDDAQRKDYASIINSSGQTLLTLLNDILDLSKVEAGKMALSNAVFSPRQLIEETANLFAQSAQAKGLSIETKWQGQSEQHYEADVIRLRQMLSNLIGNAIKFTHRGFVRIEASVLEEGNRQALLEFSVADSGIGVPLEKQAKLFHPFTQADSSTTREYGGSGLGLSIIRSLAHLMDGDAGMESETGRGSRFWFRVRVGVLDGNSSYRQTDRDTVATRLSPDSRA